MIPSCACTRRRVDPRGDGAADPEFSALDLALVSVDVGLDLLRVVHVKQRQAGTFARQFATIPNLTSGLGVEGRAVEHDGAPLPGRERLDRASVAIQRDDPALLDERAVAVE